MIRTDVLLQEVSIYSKAADTSARGTTSSVTLQSKRIEQISGPLPDVFRSIQMLPGIAVDNEYSAKFNVRGGNYDENLVIINGTQVYEPFHLKEASNASIGIFNINLMNNVEMMTGGFSAMYGDRMSSVLNIEYREGSRERYKGTATLSLTDLNLTAEGPLTSNGSFLFAVRKSYLEYAMSMVGAQSYEKPSFYDVQGIFSYSLSPSNKLLFKFIRSGDNFTNTPGPSSSQRSGLGYFQNNWSSITQVTNSYDEDDGLYYNNLLDLQDISILSGKAILKTSLSYYEQVDKVHHLDSTYFRNDITSAVKYFYLSHYTDKYDDDLNIRTLEAKITLEDQITPYYEIRSGFNYQNIQYNQNLTSVWIQNIYQNIDKYPDLSTFFYSNQPAGYTAEKINASSYKLAGYLENVVQIDKNFIFNAGGRIDYFDINKDLNLSPRLSLSYKTNFGMIIRTAWGFYYQSPIYNQLISAVASDTNTQAQKATHYILGIEDSFSLSETGNQTLTIKAEGFLKKYNQLISSSTDSYGRITYSRKNDSEGHTAGFDIYSVLNVRGFYGWLCYEYLTSKEYYISDPSTVYSRSTDQTHTLSIVTDFDLGVKWDLNIRATYGSGFAYTPYTAVYNSKNLQWNWEAGIKNSAKLPAYRRVDVRVSKELSVWSLKADLFLDVSNLFNFENVQGYSYRFDNNGYPETNEIKLWPILPSFGFTIHF